MWCILSACYEYIVKVTRTRFYLCHVYLNNIFRRCTEPAPVLWIICHYTVTCFLVRMHKDDGIWPLTKKSNLIVFHQIRLETYFSVLAMHSNKAGNTAIFNIFQNGKSHLHFPFDSDIYYHSSTAYMCALEFLCSFKDIEIIYFPFIYIKRKFEKGRINCTKNVSSLE